MHTLRCTERAACRQLLLDDLTASASCQLIRAASIHGHWQLCRCSFPTRIGTCVGRVSLAFTVAGKPLIPSADAPRSDVARLLLPPLSPRSIDARVAAEARAREDSSCAGTSESDARAGGVVAAVVAHRTRRTPPCRAAQTPLLLPCTDTPPPPRHTHMLLWQCTQTEPRRTRTASCCRRRCHGRRARTPRRTYRRWPPRMHGRTL
jgi:hypothetical protein